MKKTTAKKSEKKQAGLSVLAVAVSGFFCAVLLLGSVLALRHIHLFYSPTMENSERLLSKGKPRETISLLDKMERDDASKKRPTSKRYERDKLLLRGKALFSVLMERLREEKWGSYGQNPDNWIAHPLAEEAEKCFLDALAISPSDPEIMQTLGNLYREQGRFAAAENILRAALDIDAENSEAYLTLGLLYAEGDRPAMAKKALMAAWEFDKGNLQIAKNIAYFYRFYADMPESSIVWFNRYIDGDPKHDRDINLIKAELRNLSERYPEYGEYRSEPFMVNRGANRKFIQKQR